jgi:quinol monooxygenase YgiN
MSSAEPVVVVATFLPRPADRDQVVRILEEGIAQVHREPGCQLYALHEGTDRLVMVEKWSSAEALDQHSKADAVREVRSRMAGMLEVPVEVVVLRPHAAGDPELGLI